MLTFYIYIALIVFGFQLGGIRGIKQLWWAFVEAALWPVSMAIIIIVTIQK